ncbi:hypothetical protein LJK88_26860 [Paenibacillus sp. P26]|nr:hypothetical protein LJK88_26860 [Paenibacillus sp. P26]
MTVLRSEANQDKRSRWPSTRSASNTALCHSFSMFILSSDRVIQAPSYRPYALVLV